MLISRKKYISLVRRHRSKPGLRLGAIETPNLWAAVSHDGSRIVLCAHHLLQDADLANSGPAEGLCAVCTEPAEISRHVVERWRERVRPVDPELAGHDIGQFISGAVTVASPPSWARTTAVRPCDLLINANWPGVLLVKRREGRRGAPTVLTVLTAEAA
jgi:hypothetical protein